MSQQFFSRLINHLVNEVLVKGLAESRAFQRFAVRTQANVEHAKKVGTDMMSQGLETLSAEEMIAVNKKGPPRPPLRGFPGFLVAFGKAIRKDLGLGK